MDIDLMQFTATQLKNIILEQAPEIKGYKKKRKDLLITIIKDNQLNLENLESLTKIKNVMKPVSTIVSFD